MWRQVKRRFSISAPRLSVRPHIAWYLRWSMTLPFLLAAVALAWWAYDSGLEFAGFHRSQTQQALVQLNEQLTVLTAETAQLSNRATQYERQIQIEQANNQEILRQLKNMGDENMRLQEDLTFFQNLTATQGKAGELGVHRLKLEQNGIPGEYHVRMLLVQSGQRAKEFVGSYQLVATVLQNGQKTTQSFPRALADMPRFKLNFRYYQRIEQVIQLSADVKLEDVQVRVFEQGKNEPKIRQNVGLS
jgi:hypothetical protein